MGTRALAGVPGYPGTGTRVYVPWSVFPGWNSYASGTRVHPGMHTREPGYQGTRYRGPAGRACLGP
eukprot:431549-Rhodomonas_salina.1